MTPTRLAVITTHPIQYHIPWYQSLERESDIDVKVFYGVCPDPDLQGVGFGIPFSWDIPMLNGYPWWVSRRSNAARLRNGLFYLWTRDLADALRRWEPDVALVSGWNSLYLFQAIGICRRFGVPIVVRGEVNGLKTRPPWMRQYHAALFRRFQAFLAIGQHNRNYYLEHGVTAEKLYDAPYFVDNSRFAQCADRERTRRHELRRRFAIPAHAYCALFVGKLIAKKRVIDLLQALALIHETQRSPLHVLVVGTGAERDSLSQYAAERALPVSFAGFLNQEEIGQAYAAADLIVLPSNASETWGLVVNEAMASGLPALVSDRVGCAADLTIPGETGYTFSMGNLRELRERLLQLAGSRDASRQMGRSAQQHVMENYSIERTTRGTVRAVCATAGSRSAGRATVRAP